MSFSKLKKLHVIIIGSVLCVIAGVGVFFLQVKPQMNNYDAAKARYDAASPKGNDSSLTAAVAACADAKNKYDIKQAQLDMQMRRRMPNLNFSRRDIGMLALWQEQIKTLGPLLEDFARDKTVRANARFSIPAPPANPNDPQFDKDVLEFPLGTIAVAGDFKSLMNNVRRWNNCRRLVMVGPPTLSGQSPRLVQSYSLTCYIFPVQKGGTPIVMAGGANSQGGQPVPTPTP